MEGRRLPGCFQFQEASDALRAPLDDPASFVISPRKEGLRMKIRPALPSDARAIADVHVRTWQSTYRGIVPDAYLDALSVDERGTLLRDSITRGSPEIW